jgi:hypothetical protein
LSCSCHWKWNQACLFAIPIICAVLLLQLYRWDFPNKSKFYSRSSINFENYIQAPS